MVKELGVHGNECGGAQFVVCQQYRLIYVPPEGSTWSVAMSWLSDTCAPPSAYGSDKHIVRHGKSDTVAADFLDIYMII